MSSRAKSFALFAIGVVSGVALTLGSLMLLYLFVAKPMTDRAMKAVVARPPPFPAQPQKAVFEARWQRSDGSQVDFATMRGKVVVLNVWATWCPPCMAELPSLAQLAAHYAAQDDLKVVCVSKEQASRIWPKMSTHEAASLLVSTDGHRLPAVYQTSAIPATFVIDKAGEIVFQHVGSANWASEDTFRFLDNLRREEPNKAPVQTPVGATPVAPPPLSAVPIQLGLQQFTDGDSIVIREVLATSPRMDVGDTIIVRGRYKLQSTNGAILGLSLTQTEKSEPTTFSPAANTEVQQGSGDFELRSEVKEVGCLHLTFSRLPGRKSVGTVYFGTAEQLARVRNMRW